MRNFDLFERAKVGNPLHKADGATDHLAWAKRIVERKRRGDPTLKRAQIRFAEEALRGTAEPEISVDAFGYRGDIE